MISECGLLEDVLSQGDNRVLAAEMILGSLAPDATKPVLLRNMEDATSALVQALATCPSYRDIFPPISEKEMSAIDQEVSRKAYLLWEQAGRPEGQSEKFWLQAEREVWHARQHRS